MNKQLKLTIKGIQSHSGRTRSTQKIQSSGNSLPFIHLKQYHEPSLQQKLSKIKGNLNMLEKKYKSNLKEGFDQKIKAYRLQAAVQRKLLKHTIQQVQKYQQEQTMKEKLIENEKQKRFKEFLFEKVKIKQQQTQRYIRIRNLKEKRRLLITMQEKRIQYNNSVKKIHDQIVIQQSNSNKKRDYFEYIKKEALKKDESRQKRQILGKLVENNQKLKELKEALFERKHPVSARDNTFLTV